MKMISVKVRNIVYFQFYLRLIYYRHESTRIYKLKDKKKETKE